MYLIPALEMYVYKSCELVAHEAKMKPSSVHVRPGLVHVHTKQATINTFPANYCISTQMSLV